MELSLDLPNDVRGVGKRNSAGNVSVGRSAPQVVPHSCIHSPSDSLTHSLIHSFTHSLTHSLTHSFAIVVFVHTCMSGVSTTACMVPNH